MEKIDPNRCFECGSTSKLHNHHIVPQSLGGKRTLPLCLKCHGLIHGRNFENIDELRRKGVERAKRNGLFKGRMPGSVETTKVFLNKPKSRVITGLLNQGWSVRKICGEIGCSPNTVMKIRKMKRMS